jgi:hypothetical protein
LVAGFALLTVTAPLTAQQLAVAAEVPPDAPQPQILLAAAEPPAPPSAVEKSPLENSAEPSRDQQKPREPEFALTSSVVYSRDAASLTKGQKMNLAFHSAVSPFTIAKSFALAGYHEAMNDDQGFGWGVEGYGKRTGAAYLDAFDSNMIGKGILPSILHQDPRYFRRGQGSTPHRLFYALATTVICKHDHTGKWEPNYSNVLGHIAASGLSNLYYPSGSVGVGKTFSDGLTSTALGGVTAVFKEFWPEVSRKILHRDPTKGLDAQYRASEQAEQAK